MSAHKRATAAANLRLHRALRSELDKHDIDRLNFPINVGIAVASLGASIALGLLLPLAIYKVIIGAAFVVAVVSIGMLIHRRLFKAKAPVVEEAPDGR